MHKLPMRAALLSLALLFNPGCSTHQETVSTTERTDYPSGTTVQQTETSTTNTKQESGGVLSSTVDVVGEVIALPFRAVGALFRAIF